MPFARLNLRQQGWRQFEAQCKGIPKRDDWYHVEDLDSSLWVCILKDGRSKKATSASHPCPDDFIVKLYDPTAQEWVWQPDYTRGAGDTRSYKAGLISDLHHKLVHNHRLGMTLWDALLHVAAGDEPVEHATPIALCRSLPGRAIDEILYCFKWLLAQEGVNYPIPRYGGRRYTLYRIQEVVDGVDIEEVIARSRAKGRVPTRLVGVDYGRVDRALGL